MKKTTRPKPPEDLDGEALLEWHRLCDELDDAGKLDKADRAIIGLAAETYATWRAACKHVREFGPVVEVAINKTIGRNPFYVVMRETAAQLHSLIVELGLTPTRRHGKKAVEEAEAFDFE